MRMTPMTSGSPWKHILKFSFPVLAGSLLQQLYQTADTVIVGNFTGENALAAVGTTNTLTFFFLAIAIGLSAGNGVLIAHSFGAGKSDRMRKEAATGIILLTAAGILAMIAGIIFARPVYRELVAVPPEILEDTLLYFRIYCSGLLFQYLFNILAAILRSVGDSAATLYFLLLASILNILLDLLFVAQFNWGITGAAVATNISQAASVAAAWYYMWKKYPIFRFSLPQLRWNNDHAFNTIKIGMPIALQLVFVAIGLTFIQRAVNSFGQAMTAAFAAGQRIEMYLHLPCNALQTTLATFTGQNAGAEHPERIRSGAFQGVLISFLITLILSVPVWGLSAIMPGWFALTPTAAEYCRGYLQAIAMIVIILSVYVPLFGVFQGTKHAIIPTVTALFALSLRVAVTYALKSEEFMGHRIIYWNGLFGFCLGCMITWSYYFSGRWKHLPD